jgi:hypothetical protein
MKVCILKLILRFLFDTLLTVGVLDVDRLQALFLNIGIYRANP